MGAPFDKSDYEPLVAFAFEQLAVAGTAVGFTAATLSNAKMATVWVEDGAVRYRASGTPTATVGEVLETGDRLIVWGEDCQNILFIRRDGASGDLHCTFYR